LFAPLFNFEIIGFFFKREKLQVHYATRSFF